MSIVKPSYRSPLPSIENKNLKAPKYIMNAKGKSKKKGKSKVDSGSINTTSNFVKENLKYVERNKEKR